MKLPAKARKEANQKIFVASNKVLHKTGTKK